VNDEQARTRPVAAAVVTLRLDGQVFGRGWAASPDPDPLVVWEATRKAISSASSKLTKDRDAMWDAYIKQLSSRVAITLELGDSLIPISENELSLPGFGYSPGSMGLVVRREDSIRAMGSESQLVSRSDPARGAGAMALSLSDDSSLVLEDPAELGSRGFVFYRFVPMVLAQPAPGLGAAFVDRGGRVIGLDEIKMGTVRTMSRHVAEHLMSRVWPGVERYGLMGTLDPVTGQSESSFAEPFEQALGAYALLRYGRDGQSGAQRDAVRAGRDILRDLGRVEPRETAAWDSPTGSCMAVVALSELPLEMILGDEHLGELRSRCLDTLDTLYDETDGFSGSVPQGAWGLVAHALAVSAKIDPRDRVGLASSALARVFLDIPATQLPAQMPFLLWAQLEVSGSSGAVDTEPALAQMRALVWEHQLRRADLDWVDRDLAGGIVFTSAKAPLPSWAGLRPLCGIATMLGDERLTPGDAGSGDVPMQITRLIESVRFVRQLLGEGEILHLYSAVEPAQWGVRMALWDQRMPVESDAMGLLMLSEMSRSFDAILSR